MRTDLLRSAQGLLPALLLLLAARPAPPMAPAVEPASASLPAGVPCLDNIECADCNPCTHDVCAPGVCLGGDRPGWHCFGDASCPNGTCSFFGAGVTQCVNAAVSEWDLGKCQNSHTCTLTGLQQLQYCQSGVCVASTLLCPALQDCNPFRYGLYGLGTCRPTCIGDSQCTDGLFCNGLEECDTYGMRTGIAGICYTEGTCQGGSNDGAACVLHSECDSNLCTTNPCGQGAPCFEPNSPDAVACIGAFPDNVLAGTYAGVCCGFGRCCDDGSCSRTAKKNCPAAWLGTGDSASTETSDDSAGCAVPGTGNPLMGWDPRCPQYSAGIVPRGAFTLDNDQWTPQGLPPVIGNAECEPNFEIGDDYTLDIPDGRFLKVRTVRYYVGAANWTEAYGTTLIAFYDDQARLIRDHRGSQTPRSAALQTVTINATLDPDDEIIIPKSGYLVFSVHPDSDASKFIVLTTTGPPDSGGNDEAVVWLNGGVASAASVLGPGIPGVMAIEIVGDEVDPPVGACCDVAGGQCSVELEWVCRQAGNAFQGIGTLCQACSGDDVTPCASGTDCTTCRGGTEDGLDCGDPSSAIACRNGGGYCPGGTCLPFLPACSTTACCNTFTGQCAETSSGLCCPGRCGGVETGPLCDDAADCPPQVTCIGLCTGGETQTCLSDSDCVPADECVPGCPPNAVGQGYGSNCTPNCCREPPAQYTGGDNCEDVVVHILNVNPDPNVTTTVTITGDNSAASLPDSCQILFVCSLCDPPIPERGWWEAFAISDCANLRVDYCCSDPLRQIQWGFLSNDCPCSGATSHSLPVPPPVGILEDDSEFGWPFCNDGNLWHTFGPLPAGHYFYPVFSATDESRGPYQMHVTAAACPRRACCLSDAMCVDDLTNAVGMACPNGQGDCPPGATCSFCTELNMFDCDDAGGYWLGEGRLPAGEDAVVECVSGRCDIGSCCHGGGICRDALAALPPCSPTETVNCITRAMCDAFDGRFVGGARCHYPVDPCPICELERDDNCQLRAGGEDYELGTLSDLAAGQMAADDFIPQGDSISRLCVTGQYVSQDPNQPDVKCADDSGVVDKFLVRVYANDPASNLPGSLIGEATATVTSKGLDHTTNYLEWHKLQLQLSSPITGLTPGQCHWLEVTNNTNETTIPDAVNKCRFYWASHISVGGSHEGNRYSAIAAATPAPLNGPSPYVLGNHRAVDMIFCLDIPFEANGCGDIAGACCACDATTCGDSTRLWTCNAQTREWHGEDPDCSDVTCSGDPPPGDTCDPDKDGTPDGAIVATDGHYVAHTQCTNTDGPSGDRCPPCYVFDNDLWYSYTSTCTGTLTLSMCGSGMSYDALIAAYTNYADRRTCRCPGETGKGTTSWPPEATTSGDEGCHRGFIGSGFLTGRVQKGDCILVRLGGYGAAVGDASLTIQCEPLICPIADAPTIVQHDSDPKATTSLVDLKMNRYLGIRVPPGAAGRQQAIRVDFVNLPPPFDIWNGRQLWVQEPVSICESSGTDAPGPPCPGGSTATFMRSFLGCTPFYRDWTTVPGGVIYITHPGIVPSRTFAPAVNAEYEIRMIDFDCSASDPRNYSAPITPLQNRYGDMAGPFDFSGGYYTSPEGNNVGITTDVTAILNKFANRPGAPIKPRADLEPCRLDSKINISDVNQALNAFRNLPYPFAPGSGNCPSLDPCAYNSAGQE